MGTIKILIWMIVLLSSVQMVNAWSDDFDTCDLSQWSLSSGWSCTQALQTLDGTNYSLSTSYAPSSVQTTDATHTGLSGSEMYFEVTMRSNYSFTGAETGTVGDARFLFLNNGTNYITAIINKAGTISTTSFSNYQGTAKQPYRLVFTLTGTTLRRQIYNVTGTLVSDASATISVPVSPDRIVLYTIVNNAASSTSTLLASFDNVIVQTYAPYSAPSITNWGNSITNNQNTTIYIP